MKRAQSIRVADRGIPPTKNPPGDYDPQQFTTPLERGFEKLVSPFQDFVANQATSSILLLVCTAAALLVANSPLHASYDALLRLNIGFHFGEQTLDGDLIHWINEGLMAIFFFVLGLEIKREFIAGELREPRQAILLALAAAGGMAMPALIYHLFNPDGIAARGWGIPMTTDTAFAIGALALFGSRVPKALMIFIAALAIVDDIGTVLVIALFYSSSIHGNYLAAAAVLLGLLLLFNVLGLRRPQPYLIVGALVWFAVLKSGVHATVAGILVAFTVPARPRLTQRHFLARMRELMGRFRAPPSEENIIGHERQHDIVRTVEETARLASTPLQRWAHSLQHTVALAVIPIFALANAGIAIEFSSLGETLLHPVTLGVAVGLVVGKFVGITTMAWLALKTNIGTLPTGVTLRDVAALALLAGMGATMSLFIAGLGFSNDDELLLMAKTGTLLGSLIAAIGGALWLWIATRGAAPRPDARSAPAP